MDFYQRFEVLCKAKREKTTSVGTQLGFSKGGISKWRHGECVPSANSLKRIANYFGVSVDYLLGKTDIPNAQDDFEDLERAKLILFGTDEVPEKAWWEVKQFVKSTKLKYHIDNSNNQI